MSEFKHGSVRELWRVSYPMMISFFSMMLMIFVDRLFLSWYSSSALNASVQAGTLAWGVIVGWMTMATMAEVFVAQYNGAKRYTELGAPVWQMIWLALASYVFFIPAAIWGTALVYDPVLQPDEYIYFKYLMYFGPFVSIVPAFGGFFIGRGKPQIMQWMAILGNVVNIILDPLFIFGLKNVCPSMGICGAAIATGLGNVIQAAILFLVFIRKKNREEFNTHKCGLNFPLMLSTLKIGLPPSALFCFEVIGWAVFFHWMAAVSPLHIFVSGVCQSVLLLYYFFGLGMEKGTIAMAGNFVGANEPEKVRKVLYSGIKLLGMYSIFVALSLIIYPDPLINWFLNNPENLEHGALMAKLDMAEVHYYIRIGLIFTAILILCENLRWIVGGILTATGDTMFLLLSGAFNVWFVLLVPTYFFIVSPKSDITYAFVIWGIYGIFSAALIYMRFLQGKWQKKIIIKEIAIEPPE